MNVIVSENAISLHFHPTQLGIRFNRQSFPLVLGFYFSLQTRKHVILVYLFILVYLIKKLQVQHQHDYHEKEFNETFNQRL